MTRTGKGVWIRNIRYNTWYIMVVLFATDRSEVMALVSVVLCGVLWPLTMRVFSYFLIFNFFGAKFQTTFVVCFIFILTNYCLERCLYVKLKDCMSNCVDPEETAHGAVSPGSMLFAKAYYYCQWQ